MLPHRPGRQAPRPQVFLLRPQAHRRLTLPTGCEPHALGRHWRMLIPLAMSGLPARVIVALRERRGEGSCGGSGYRGKQVQRMALRCNLRESIVEISVHFNLAPGSGTTCPEWSRARLTAGDYLLAASAPSAFCAWKGCLSRRPCLWNPLRGLDRWRITRRSRGRNQDCGARDST
jgi:hypothetical protein